MWRLVKLLRIKQRKELFKGLSALFSLQFVNMILPLLTLPYLARVLGVESLGVLAFFQAIAAYIIIVVEFGVEFSGTRAISKNIDNNEYVSKQFWGVFYLKFCISFIALFLLLLAQFYIPILAENFEVMIFAFLMGSCQAFGLNWFYQAINKVVKISYLEITSRLIAVISIFLLIDNENDVWLVFAIYAVCNMFFHLLSYFIAFTHVKFKAPSLNVISSVIKNSSSMFIFKGAASLYTIANTVLIGLLCPIQYAGYYAYADKIIKALRGFINPINRIVFAKINSVINKDIARTGSIFRVSTMVTLLLAIFTALIVFLFSEDIVYLLLGEQFNEVIYILQLMAVLLPIVALSNSLGICWMLPNGLDWPLIRIVCIAAIFNIVIALFFIPKSYHIGATYSLLVTEVLILSLIFMYLHLTGNNPFSKKIRARH